jgi:hypothetical protein
MTTVSSARHDWEQGYRSFRSDAAEPVASERLHAQLDVVTDEIRRRIGGTFTLDELVELYGGSDRWAREALGERAPRSGWERTLSEVLDAAFHLYSRGAQDYLP